MTLPPPEKSPLTATELRGMPRDRRDLIMEEAARIAEALYRNDPSLTDFEAFEVGESDGEAASKG